MVPSPELNKVAVTEHGELLDLREEHQNCDKSLGREEVVGPFYGKTVVAQSRSFHDKNGG